VDAEPLAEGLGELLELAFAAAEGDLAENADPVGPGFLEPRNDLTYRAVQQTGRVESGQLLEGGVHREILVVHRLPEVVEQDAVMGEADQGALQYMFFYFQRHAGSASVVCVNQQHRDCPGDAPFFIMITLSIYTRYNHIILLLRAGFSTPTNPARDVRAPQQVSTRHQ